MSRSIHHSFYLPHSPEKVWKYLTIPELIEKWLMPNTFKPELGAEFQFKTKPLPKFGFDGNVYCKVLEIDPYKCLQYTWVGGMPGKPPTLESVVTWKLQPEERGVILHLEHSGFSGFKNIFGFFAMRSGWKKIGRRISKLIEKEVYGHSPA